MTGWSPEQIANRLKVEFPDDESMQISHEAIYQALYVQGRGALNANWSPACAPAGRYGFHGHGTKKAWAHVTSEVLISERPAEAEDRAVPGHWEGDLIIGLQRSAIGTLVERTHEVHDAGPLAARGGLRRDPRTKNGPALAGYGAITMKNALAADDHHAARTAAPVADLGPRQRVVRARTFKVETGVPVFFADPHSPWQRGTNENTNGLLRQYFPKGTDLSRWSDDEIQAVAPRSTADRERPSAGRPQPKHSTNSYGYSNQPVVRRSVESGQYTSRQFAQFCKDKRVRTSVGRTGVCWDNAAAESFFAALKNEMYYRHSWPTRARSRFAVAEYIEVFYNRRRLHSTLGYRTPFEALTDHQRAATAA